MLSLIAKSCSGSNGSAKIVKSINVIITLKDDSVEWD
jgi:hypothetical protein